MIEKVDNGKWIVEVEDAGDGSGDAILPIPLELMELMGLKDGDDLDFKVLDDGSIIATARKEPSSESSE